MRRPSNRERRALRRTTSGNTKKAGSGSIAMPWLAQKHRFLGTEQDWLLTHVNEGLWARSRVSGQDRKGLARPQVVNALTTAYGSASELLVSLWNSRNLHDWSQCPFEDEGCSDCKESADQILNRNFEEKRPAYAWLDQGADEILDGSAGWGRLDRVTAN